MALNVLQKMVANMGFRPRNGAADGYPYDLDGSLRYVRLATGIDIFPTHSNADNFAKLGQVSGIMPQQDMLVWGQMYAPIPYGPIMNPMPENLQWQIIIPGLNKQVAQSN